MDTQTQLELEAAAFRALRSHLMEKRTDVQNIDLMNLAGFCRNCLSRWYQEAAADKGIEMSKDAAGGQGRRQCVLQGRQVLGGARVLDAHAAALW